MENLEKSEIKSGWESQGKREESEFVSLVGDWELYWQTPNFTQRIDSFGRLYSYR